MANLMTFMLMCFLPFLSLLISLHNTCALETHTDLFHSIQLTSLRPASTCNPSPHEDHSREEEGFLKLVRNHGPCSPHGQLKAPSFSEILKQDEFRLNFKRMKKKLNNNNNFRDSKSKSISIPLKPLDPKSIVDSYVVSVFLGTPKRKLTLVADTGSDLLWTQCRPCLGGCYSQINPIFDPSKSSTYSNIACSSPLCKESINTTGFAPLCRSKTCVFTAQYLSTRPIQGFLAKETLSLTPNNTLKGIVFGCSQFNQDFDFGVVDGIMGLGTASFSLVQQTSNRYHRVFSYCLTSKPSETGFLRFGKAKPVSKSLKFTQLGQDQNLDLVGIKFAGTKLPISFKKGSASIDSGAVVSRLPSNDYAILRNAYRKFMSKYGYKLVTEFEKNGIDTCYKVGGQKNVVLPKMSFLFGNGIEVDINPSGLALFPDPRNTTLFCLPFIPYPNNEESMIFGATQQHTLEIVYDVAGGRIGFGYGGCK